MRAREALGPERLIELVALVGYGCMLSLAVNTSSRTYSRMIVRWCLADHPQRPMLALLGGPRLAPLQEAALSDRQQRIATQPQRESWPKGAYATWLRTPEIAERALQYEQVLYGNLSVPPSFVELVVLVVARFWTADELWGVHRDRDAGLVQTS